MNKDYSDMKPYVKQMYLNNMTAAKLCELFAIPSSTIYSWITRDKWDDEKNALQSKSARSPEILRGMLDDILVSFHERRNEISVKEIVAGADAIAKITKSLKSLYKDQDYLEMFLKLFSEFLAYLNQQNLSEDFRNKLSELSKGFSSHLVTKYSAKNFK